MDGPMRLVFVAALAGLIPAISFAQGTEAPDPAPEAERIIGAIACVPALPYRLRHLSEPLDESDTIGTVPTANCYPTAGCDNGWCAVETTSGMGWVADPGITVIVPTSGDGPEADAGCGLFAIIATVDTEAAAQAMIEQDFPAENTTILNHNRLPNFEDGKVSVALGPFAAAEVAEQALSGVDAPEGYVKPACATPTAARD
ncbi:hypothetical protein PAA8504_00710 [Palleronia abyssalis]|uniref:SPOR domain-containing protein n=2 Tax=Palleronia abyssalis TaxID=1501240 RepID=A0A2R8BS06_9RHOB|nr:hypothetical protein PAA8504_00710 [Palleronia abyssalis]